MERRKTALRISMTEGSLMRNMFLFSLPLMLSNILQVLFNMSDVAVVGRFGSENALGSVGSTSTYVALFTGIMIGLGAGINAVMAQKIGADDKEGIFKVSHTGFLLFLFFGVLVAVLAITLAKPILMAMGTKEDFLDGALMYVYIYFIGAPATALFNFGSGVLSADGLTKQPLIFLLISGLTNIGLNLFFVIVCQLSVIGVALASAISQWLSCVLVIFALKSTKRPYKLFFSRLKMDKAIAKSLIVIGVPAGIQNAIFQVANLFIQAGINSFDKVVVEGNTAAANADTFVFELMAGFYTGCTSFIGQNYGANKKQRILKCYYVALFYACAFGLIAGLLLYFAGDLFLSIFTADPLVIKAGKERLSVMCFSFILSGFMDNTIAAARGLNKTVIPTILVILGSCVFRIFWVFCIFPLQNTTTLLYLLFPASWVITSVAEIIYFVIIYKKTVRQSPANYNLKDNTHNKLNIT